MDATSIFLGFLVMLWQTCGGSNISIENDAFLPNTESPKWPQTSERASPNTQSQFKREINSKHPIGCHGALSCHCYSRATRSYFCCKCLDDTCFPENALVQLENGSEIKMMDLRIGHRILSRDIYTDRMAFSPVIAFLERRTEIYGTYLTLRTNGSKVITLSGIHLMFTTSGVSGSSRGTAQYAKDFVLDDHVFVSGNGSHQLVETIVDIEREVRKGAYVPLTESGTLFVGGVLASCYASISSHTLAHLVLSPVRFWPDLFETTNSQFDNGVRLYVQVLKVVGKWLLPSSIASLALSEDVPPILTRNTFIHSIFTSV